MRFFGHAKTPPAPSIPDTRLSVLLTAATQHAFDYPSGTDLFRISVGSTIASLGGPVFLAPSSTSAALPTTGAVVSTVDSSGGIPIMATDPRIYQRPRGSTGFSLIAGSSYSVCVEFWTRTNT